MASFNDIRFLSSDQITATHQKFENARQLIEAQKHFSVLGMIPFINCLEIDEEYIIAAGFDKDITVYAKDLPGNEFIYRFHLIGHQAAITGLKIWKIAEEKILISSSEDGSIRKWSLTDAHEIACMETGRVINCLGLSNNSHAVICTDDGYLCLYSLDSELLTVSIHAHVEDPIKVLEVGDKYIATASFNDQCSLKVWKISFDNFSILAVANYIIQEPPLLPFSIALWKSKILVPVKNKVLIINIEEENSELLNFNRDAGRVICLKIHKKTLITVSSYRNRMLVDVHSLPAFDHLGTFITKNKQIKVIAASGFEHSLTIIIGGKSLTMWQFEWPVQNIPEQGGSSHSNGEWDNSETISAESDAIASGLVGSNTEAGVSSLLPSTSQGSSIYQLHCTICKITVKPGVVFMVLQCGHITCKCCCRKLFRRKKNNPVRCETCNKIIKWKSNRKLVI